MEQFLKLVGHDADPITWWQMLIRATVVFAYAIALYRITPTRAFGKSAALDILVVVIIGSSLSRALTGSAPLLPTMAATALLVALHMVLSWLARRYDPVSWLVKGRPLQLIRGGELDRGALRRAHLGERDLSEHLRLSGVARVEDVAEAYLERNGEISVIKARRQAGGHAPAAGATER